MVGCALGEEQPRRPQLAQSSAELSPASLNLLPLGSTATLSGEAGTTSELGGAGTASTEPSESSGGAGAAGSESAGVPATFARINELKVDPPSTDGNQEFIELRGTPLGSLEGFALLLVEGDSGTTKGRVDAVIDLGAVCSVNPCRFGSNGLLLLLPLTDSVAPQDPATSVGVVSELEGGGIENGSTSVLLIASPSALTTSTDLDPEDSGLLTLPPETVVHDAVATSDGGTTDSWYALSVLGPKPAAHAAFRCGDELTHDSWYFGQLTGDSTSLVFDPTKLLPADLTTPVVLTPGAANHCTTVIVDVPGSGGSGDPGSGDSGAGGAAVEAGGSGSDASLGGTTSDASLGGTTSDASLGGTTSSVSQGGDPSPGEGGASGSAATGSSGCAGLDGSGGDLSSAAGAGAQAGSANLGGSAGLTSAGGTLGASGGSGFDTGGDQEMSTGGSDTTANGAGGLVGHSQGGVGCAGANQGQGGTDSGSGGNGVVWPPPSGGRNSESTSTGGEGASSATDPDSGAGASGGSDLTRGGGANQVGGDVNDATSGQAGTSEANGFDTGGEGSWWTPTVDQTTGEAGQSGSAGAEQAGSAGVLNSLLGNASDRGTQPPNGGCAMSAPSTPSTPFFCILCLVAAVAVRFHHRSTVRGGRSPLARQPNLGYRPGRPCRTEQSGMSVAVMSGWPSP